MSTPLASVLAPALASTARLLAAGSAAVALTAGGASFQPLTYEERDLGDSSNVQVGSIDVRNVTVEAPEEGYVHEAGATLAVTFTLSNRNPEADTLTEVTTDAAGSVRLLEGGREVEEIEVPEQGVIGADIEVELEDTTRELRAGEYVDLTVVFEKNGSETFRVPISTPTGTAEREHSELVHPEEEH